MIRILTLFICFVHLSFVVCCQSAYWQQQVNYSIDVTLNDVQHTLDGFVKMEYTNNSPDTLRFIWIHCWPNAYKNDKTAFTDQALENGSTRFYFSNNEERGYMNRLDFRVNGTAAVTEDHSRHQDIVKLILPHPLPPHASAKIETPFHVKLPDVFSRGGHVGNTYQVTQWFPKAAVYDRKGWHPMPYLDQGEFYSDFGNYQVQITVPQDYVVAATGELQNAAEKKWQMERQPPQPDPVSKKQAGAKKPKQVVTAAPAPVKTKTLVYRQDNVHDFAWFADKMFIVKTDTLRLPSGRVVTAAVYYYRENETNWANSIAMIKRAVQTKSQWLGEYPFNVVTVVDGGVGGGMEYPTITVLDDGGSEKSLDFVIDHEVGHNWFQGILASNERLHPWMDEGMNTYYDNRYSLQQYGTTNIDIVRSRSAFANNRLPDDLQGLLVSSITAIKKDQPIETTSENFNAFNYNIIAYSKTGQWMQLLERELGKPLFDSCMREYYRRWQFKHPYPEDFKKLIEEVSGRNLDNIFALLSRKGPIPQPAKRKDIRFAALFSLKDTRSHNYIFGAPAIGYNFYDKLMLGVLLHNYTLPFTRFQFVLSPLYATKSKQFNGIGRMSYSFYPGNRGQRLELAVAGASFSGDNFTDSAGVVHPQRFTKIAPSVKYFFANKNPRSTLTKFIQWRTFLIREQSLLFTRDTINQIDIIRFPNKDRYLNQLRFVIENNRVLYPYRGELQADQGDGFVRLGFTGNYFFNYPRGGGLDLRVFAGKFFYLGDRTFLKQFETDPYQLNMTGPKGYEDYTYSNYFIGRNEFNRFSSQQIMMRDGGFKVRTDLLSNKIGKTDDWLIAANLVSPLPNAINPLSVLPFKIPIRVFVDIGTYAGAWKKNAETGRFVYDAGLQLSLFRNVLNIYVPLLYSKVYRDYFKSTIPEKRFWKTVSFSIDIQHINLRRWAPQIPF